MSFYSTIEAWNGVGGTSPLGDINGSEGFIDQSIFADDAYFRIELYIASFTRQAIQDDLDLKIRIYSTADGTARETLLEESSGFIVPRTDSGSADAYYKVVFSNTKPLSIGQNYLISPTAIIDSEPSAGYLGSIIGDVYKKGTLNGSRNDAAMRLEFSSTYIGDPGNNLTVTPVSASSSTDPASGSPSQGGISIGNISGDGNVVVIGTGSSVNIGNNVNSGNTTNNVSNSFSIGSIAVDMSTVLYSDRKSSDEIIGTSAGESLRAGKGRDTLQGRGGSDTFIFDVKDKYGKKSADTITDFNSSEGDAIALSRRIFTGQAGLGSLQVAQNSKMLKSMASDDNAIIYLQPSGEIYFNQNGSDKGFGKGGLFAILYGGPSLQSGDVGSIA